MDMPHGGRTVRLIVSQNAAAGKLHVAGVPETFVAVDRHEAEPAGIGERRERGTVVAGQIGIAVDYGERVTHGLRPILLALPVLVHDSGKAAQIAPLERRFALAAELLDLVQ